MLPNLTLDLEDAVEAAMLPKTKVVIIDEPVVVLSEAEDSVQAVADSVGGATRRRGSEAAEAVHEGARHVIYGARGPQREGKRRAKESDLYYY